MKIRFLEDTYIRSIPKSKGNKPLGTIHVDAEIEVEAVPVKGESLEKNNRWYRDKNGWHYWSGRTEIVEEKPPTPGETHGGILVTPAHTQAIDASKSEPPTSIPLAVPPLANDDAQWGAEEIPKGETRLVPSLDILLEQEKRATPFVLPPANTRQENPVSPRITSAPPAQEPIRQSRGMVAPEPPMTAPTAEAPPSISIEQKDSTTGFLQNLEPQKLNWAVQNYLIAKDWWQKNNTTGRKVTIAILSTGAPDKHPNLPNQAGSFIYSGADTPIMQDLNGLGTQAAVIAAGAGRTVFGIAPEASLLIAKMSDQDYLFSPDALIAALAWAIEAGADIIAMLADFPELNTEQLNHLQQLVKEATQRNILLVAPVGTAENKKPESRYPACLPGVLSVGAHDQFGQRCRFSARSFDLDLLAPGENLLTSGPGGQTTTSLKTTAIAAAFVAGFLALIRHWQWEHHLELTPDEVYDLLRKTAVSRRSFNKGEDVEYGHGILNPIEILNQIEQ